MSYEEPPVTSGSGDSFHNGGSSSPIPVPPSSIPIPAADIPVPSSGLSSSDKENSSIGSFQSTHQVVNELVEIMEADLEVDDEEAQALSDVMDAEVRSHLYQRCKSKRHCQGHSSLDAPSELNLLQKIPSPFKTPLVPQAEG